MEVKMKKMNKAQIRQLMAKAYEVKSQGGSLSKVFEDFAEHTGRAKGSIRNVYYATLQETAENEEYKKEILCGNALGVSKIIGFKDMTNGAGATTLVYLIKKFLAHNKYVVALEVNKNDFGFFNEKDMYSVNQNNLSAAINKFGNATYVLVDINNGNIDVCDEVIYMIEPSIIKLNKMMLINKKTEATIIW